MRSAVALTARCAPTANERSHGVALASQVLRHLVTGKGVLTYSTSLDAASAKNVVRNRRPRRAAQHLSGGFKDDRIGVPGRAAPPSAQESTISPASPGARQMWPLSRGHVEARSPEPAEAPAINPRYPFDPTDRRAISGGLRFVRRLLIAPALARYCGVEILPGSAVESDDELLHYARQKDSIVYHATCTCKMDGNRMAVVDNQLACTGSKDLRVVDASVMPTVLRSRRGPVAGCASLTRPTADLPMPAMSRMWAAFGQVAAPPKPQASISAAIPLMS